MSARERLMAAPWMLLPGAALMEDMVLAIEAEAVAACRADLRARIEGLPEADCFAAWSHVERRAVLAAIDQEPQP